MGYRVIKPTLNSLKTVAEPKKARGNAKLTIEEVKRIKELLREGLSPRMVIHWMKLNTSFRTVEKIRNGETWAHVGGDTKVRPGRRRLRLPVSRAFLRKRPSPDGEEKSTKKS